MMMIWRISGEDIHTDSMHQQVMPGGDLSEVLLLSKPLVLQLLYFVLAEGKKKKRQYLSISYLSYCT